MKNQKANGLPSAPLLLVNFNLTELKKEMRN